MSAGSWLLLLVAVIVVGPYVLGVPPRSARDWRAIMITVIFVGVRLGIGTLRSR